MYDRSFIIDNNIVNSSRALKKSYTKYKNNNNDSFKSIFQEEIINNIQFSKHANMRLNERNISLSNEQLRRVEDGIDNAKRKGINDSLILVDDVALVININSRTVITALNNEQKNIFTNIDGAVIV